MIPSWNFRRSGGMVLTRTIASENMNAKKYLAWVNCCLVVQVGFGLLAGCASEEARESQSMTAQAQTDTAGHKTRKAVISADQVPDAVQRAFQTKFPRVQSAEWKLKSAKVYESEFTLKGTEITVMFDATGKWLETESAVDPAKVPSVVRDAAAKQFNGYKVVETQSVERWNEPGLTYELHLENAKEIAKVRFSDEGTILNQSAKVKP